MGKSIPAKAAKQTHGSAAVAVPSLVEVLEDVIAPVDPNKAKRAVSRDAAIVITLHTVYHAHDPIDPHEADHIFKVAVKGLADRMLLPILSSGNDVAEGGDLEFVRDTQPLTLSTDRHEPKLVRKKVKRRRQSYVSSVKGSICGSYAPSRASSRSESKLGGSRSPSISLRGPVAASRMPKLSIAYSLMEGQSMVNLPWINSQQGYDTASNAIWQPGRSPTRKSVSRPSSLAGTARGAVDFVELERRAEIERDLNTRESVQRSAEGIARKAELRVKLRSLADPSISLEKEESMAGMDAKGRRSRQGPRGNLSGILQPPLSPLEVKSVVDQEQTAADVATFRSEDYKEMSSGVVLLGKRGELVVGENCFVVSQKLRQELLLDLHSRSAIQPRIQIPVTLNQDDRAISNQADPSTAKQNRHSSPPRSLKPSHSSSTDPVVSAIPVAFENQTGSFQSSPILALDLQTTPLAKGVVMKIIGVPVSTSPSKAAATSKQPRKSTMKTTSSLESVLNTKSEPLPKSSTKTLESGAMKSQSESTLQPLPRNQQLHTTKSSASAGSPVVPKHIQNGEKHLQSLRIRTPACPKRVSRKTSSQSSLFVGDDEDGWDVEETGSLFSLHEQHASTSSLPTLQYVREFPKPPQGRIQLFRPVASD